MRGARRRRLGAALMVPLSAILAACGTETALTLASIGVPDAQHPAVLGTATYHTSPDGGIYDNPDPLQVTLVGRVPMQALAQPLGAEHQWSALAPYGALTVVGFQLHNSGLAGSDPQLNDLQVAADLAPKGAPQSTISRFYYPAYPLAGLSTVSVSSQCQVHLDPGQTISVVLVYPPIRSTTYVTWGEYGSFAIAIPVGGEMARVGDLKVSLCTPPQAQPT
jgi:hypothetical protein